MIKKIEKYGASWCAPCKLIDKTLENVPSNIELIKIDVEDSPELAEEKKIRSIPVLIFYDENNTEINRLTGAVSWNKIEEIIR